MNIQISRAHIAQMAEQIAPMCDGDEQLLQDMLEGETDLVSLASMLHEVRARDLELLDGIKGREDNLKARKARIKARAERFKEEIGKLLRAARLPNIELPEVTYSVRNGNAKLVVTDPLAVPEELNSVSWSPDMAKIKEAYAEAESLPNWLRHDPPKDIITARSK